MALYDHAKEKTVSQVIAPAAKTATTTSAAVDLANCSAATFVVSFGVVTDGTHTPKLTECDTSGGSYTDVDAANQVGTFSGATSSSGGSANQTVAYIGSKRYIKLVVTVSGATTGALTAANVILEGRRKQP